MKVGKLLKEKYGFHKQETVDRFIDLFGYSEVIVNKILNDKYQVLLTCHIHDLAIFTGASVDELHDAQELPEQVSELRPYTPMGKPYITHPPISAKLAIMDYPNILVGNEPTDPALKALFKLVREKYKKTPFTHLPVKTEVRIKDIPLGQPTNMTEDDKKLVVDNVMKTVVDKSRDIPGGREGIDIYTHRTAPDMLFGMKALAARHPGTDPEVVKMFLDSDSELDEEKVKVMLNAMYEYFQNSPLFKEMVERVATEYGVKLELAKPDEGEKK